MKGQADGTRSLSCKDAKLSITNKGYLGSDETKRIILGYGHLYVILIFNNLFARLVNPKFHSHL